MRGRAINSLADKLSPRNVESYTLITDSHLHCQYISAKMMSHTEKCWQMFETGESKEDDFLSNNGRFSYLRCLSN